MQAQSPQDWTPKKKSAGGPIRSGHLLFLSGIGGWYPDKRPKPGDVKEQTGDALQMMNRSMRKMMGSGKWLPTSPREWTSVILSAGHLPV
jgi:enamine deaminase RidA (YjgF/YER057c/UK114 family)